MPRFLTTLLLLSLLGACGQVGDLYLPADPPPADAEQDQNKKK